MLVYGHRGASIELPENTLEAFERALAVGADAIETDVHVTSDGQVVIHHDATGQRMASERAAVRSSKLADVRRWNVGFGFRDRDGVGIVDKSFRAPTLSEALEAFPDTRFNVDIKPGDDAVDHVVAVVRRHAAEHRVLLTSFFDHVTAHLRRLGYAGDTGLARSAVLIALSLPSATPAALRPRGQRIQLPTSIGPIRLGGEAFIARMHALGYRVDYWVVNDAHVAQALRRASADGVMTDDPRAIVKAVAGPASAV